jgi:bacterioferritin B
MGKFHDAVGEQIGYEFAASQQYIAIATYFDEETLPHLAAHFYRQAVEERNHAMMLVQFLLDADQPVTIPGVAAPRTGFTNAAEPVSLALDQERRVTEQIANLLKLAREEGDFVGEEAMHWFLKEQREEVSSMSDLLKLVERALESNILLAEESLARTPVGDQGVDPSAPPAAGGAL